MKKYFVMAGAFALATIANVTTAQTVVMDDFTTLTAVNNPPAGVGTAATWYDSAQNAFSGIALEGTGGARLTDGGFTNGAYAEMDETIPTTGDFTVAIDILQLSEDSGNLDGIRGYEVGVIINGAHRDESPGNINTSNAVLTAVGSSNLTFGAATDDSVGDGLSVVDTIETAQFSATAGDSIFVILAVDADDVTQSGGWGSSFIILDELRLIPVPSKVSDWVIFK